MGHRESGVKIGRIIYIFKGSGEEADKSAGTARFLFLL